MTSIGDSSMNSPPIYILNNSINPNQSNQVAHVNIGGGGQQRDQSGNNITSANSQTSQSQPNVSKVRTYLNWRQIVFVVTPLVMMLVPWVLLPLLDITVDPVKIKTAYVTCVMAVYWVSECIPLTATALIPLVAFPLMGVTPAKEVATQYLSDGSWLFIGGLVVAVAVEETNLHRWIALNILHAVGARPGRLMFGLMCACALLSMFISNTATTAMMVPVVLSLAAEVQLAKRPPSQAGDLNEASPAEPEAVMDPRKVLQKDLLSPKDLKTARALLLCVCYSSSLGGITTITGTLPMIVLSGLLEKSYGLDHNVNYANYFLYNVPGLIIMVVLAWLWLMIIFIGVDQIPGIFRCGAGTPAEKRVQKVIQNELKSLGPLTFAQISLLSWYGLVFVLWLTRGLTNWSDMFAVDGVKYVSDTVAVISVVVILFVWPRGRNHKDGSYCPLLTWDSVEKKFPWGVVILLGGGYAIAGAAKSSGLSASIAGVLAKTDVSDNMLLVLSVILMTHLTEVTSKTATSQIMLPIMLSIAEQRCINPLYLSLAVCASASFAFMLPVATPPNAIVFAAGNSLIRVVDMMMAGCMMNLMCMCVVVLMINTWGTALFDLHTYPDWAPACQMHLVANETLTTAGL